MPRSRPASPAARPAPQLDFFPESADVTRLDPRRTVGPGTAVMDLFRVRLRRTDAPHLVFHDRHGWYCEEHGPSCAAVPEARAARDADGAANGDGTA